MQVQFIILLILYAVDLLLLAPKYITCKYDHTPLKQKLIWKELCMSIPLVSMLAGAAVKYAGGYDDPALSILIAGMFLCAVGDLVLEIKFGAGVVCFAMGHVIYIIALLMISDGISPVSIAVYAALAVAGTVLTVKLLSKKYRTGLIIYNLVVSTSFALSVSLLMSGNASKIAFGSGLICLVISDWLLARNKVFKANYRWSLIAIIPYFGGQLLIALYPWLL